MIIYLYTYKHTKRIIKVYDNHTHYIIHNYIALGIMHHT